ncbi:MAG: hypothetical protein ACRC80_37860 [Waterburya sp.]
MKLIIKSIINGLFEAKIIYERFEVTAIGHTKDEATRNALKWLKREIEMSPQSSNYHVEKYRDFDLETLGKELDDKQPLYVLKGEEWKGLERDIQLMAHEISQITLKAALRYAVRASVGGAIGFIF